MDKKDISTPLAEQMRPKSFEELVGQEHLFGDAGALRLAIESKNISSMLFWGPPGVGKTTIASLFASVIEAQFISFSAVYCGVKEIKASVVQAKKAREQDSSTVLFIDELHRFNRAQQDIFLPYVEDGTFVLVGATTENPSFEINKALLSRLNVYVLQRLSPDNLRILVKRANQFYPEIELTKEIVENLVAVADGDARRLYNNLQQLFQSASATGVNKPDGEFLNNVLASSVLIFDKQGDEYYNLISMLHKAVRGSDVDAAIYWLFRMLEGGVDPLYIARRMIRIAWEDVGLADPRAARICLDALATYDRLGSPEGELAIVGAVCFLAICAKSNSLYNAFNTTKAFVNNNPSYPVPLKFRNAPTKLMKDLGYGANYRYPHEQHDRFLADENYFPDELTPTQFYFPSDSGLEQKIKQKLNELAEKRAQASRKND